MKSFFKNYSWYLVEVISGFFSIALLFAVFSNTTITSGRVMGNLNQTVVGANVDYTLPEVQEGDFVVENGVLDKGSTFNWKDYVSVRSTNGIDLLNFIVVSGDTVNTSKPGVYDVTFTLNWNGKCIEKEASFYVRSSSL